MPNFENNIHNLHNSEKTITFNFQTGFLYFLHFKVNLKIFYSKNEPTFRFFGTFYLFVAVILLVRFLMSEQS